MHDIEAYMITTQFDVRWHILLPLNHLRQCFQGLGWSQVTTLWHSDPPQFSLDPTVEQLADSS